MINLMEKMFSWFTSYRMQLCTGFSALSLSLLFDDTVTEVMFSFCKHFYSQTTNSSEQRINTTLFLNSQSVFKDFQCFSCNAIVCSNGELSQIVIHNETNYFLKGDAAKFDHTFAHHCVDYFRKQKFVQLSKLDFIQTFLMGAFGISTENSYEVDGHRYNVLFYCISSSTPL